MLETHLPTQPSCLVTSTACEKKRQEFMRCILATRALRTGELASMLASAVHWLPALTYVVKPGQRWLPGSVSGHAAGNRGFRRAAHDLLLST
jgi:hypothetical protein